MKVRGYTELVAWQKAIVLVKDVYAVTQKFPKEEEVYGLTSQIRRAAVSVPSNIAEGQGRGTKNEFMHFLGNAKGSLYEVQTQVHIARELNYMTDDDKKRLIGSSDEIGKILNGLLSSLRHGGSD